MATRKCPIIVIILAIVVAAAGGFAYLVRRGLIEVAHLEQGMITLQLPSGATAYVRRQSFFGMPADVYLSASPDFCAPYDRSNDFKLPNVIHGGPESPLLVSYNGDTIILHGPRQLQPPHVLANSFNVIYEQLTPETYSAYVGSNKLPEGWVRVEVPIRSQYVRDVAAKAGFLVIPGE